MKISSVQIAPGTWAALSPEQYVWHTMMTHYGQKHPVGSTTMSNFQIGKKLGLKTVTQVKTNERPLFFALSQSETMNVVKM